MKPLYLMTMVMILISFTGCTSLVNRFHTCNPQKKSCCVYPVRVPHYVYPGTESDLRSLAIPLAPTGNALYDSMSCMFYPIPLIDLPLSILADTLFLPYDVYMITFGGKNRYVD